MAEQVENEHLKVWAETALNGPVTSVQQISGGRNSAVFRIDDRNGQSFALKKYPSDGRGRQLAESNALKFMKRVGIVDVPEILSVDFEDASSLLTWLEGNPVNELDDSDVLSFAKFQIALSERVDDEARKDIGPASEACLSGRRIVTQVKSRFSELEEIVSRADELQEFYCNRYLPAFEKSVEVAMRGVEGLGISFDGILPREMQTVIPSDFGSHNAVRLPSGRLAFLDFEYFGWDDPTTSLCNFLQHPAMKLTLSQREIYRKNILQAFDDGKLIQRVELYQPLFAARWIAIILSELREKKWEARHGSKGEAWQTTCSRQLDLANGLYDAYLGA